MLIFSLILVQVIIFAGLIMMLRHILTQNVGSAVKHLEDLSQEYESKEVEINRQREEIKQKSEGILADAKARAEDIRAQILKEAGDEKSKIVEQALSQKEDIIKQADKSRQRLISEIDERISKEAVNKACELIQHTLPDNFKKDVHSQWVKELIDNGFTQLKNLDIPKGIEEVKVSSAFTLSPDQRKILQKRLTDIFGREVKLKEEIDPSVITGLVISMGSLVLDGSLRNKIKEQVIKSKNENAE